MANLVYVTRGLSGGLNASLEIARRVVAQGHTISFVGHRDVGATIEAHSYGYTRVDHDERALHTLRASIEQRGHVRSLLHARRLRKQVIESREIERAVVALRPDALIVDVEAHYALIATHNLGIPTLAKSDFFSMAHESGVPPLHSELGMPTNLVARGRAEFEWVKARVLRIASRTVGELHPRRLARRWTPFRYDTISRRDLSAVAAARGIELDAITGQQGWLWPHTYPDLPLISSTPRELDFVTTTSANDTRIGPLVAASRRDLLSTDDEVARWNEFKLHNRERDRPLLYCSFGTILPDTTAMQRVVLDMMARRPEWDLVIGLGGRGVGVARIDSSASSDAVNVLVLPYAPQLDVLASADVAIIHGGINGILESLTFGVPMIVERHGPVDGPGNASRVEHFGVGHRVTIAELTPLELADLVESTLADTAMRTRIELMQTQFQSYQEDSILESVIERLVNGGFE